jgi:hypothetical protein
MRLTPNKLAKACCRIAVPHGNRPSRIALRKDSSMTDLAKWAGMGPDTSMLLKGLFLTATLVLPTAVQDVNLDPIKS